MNHSSKSIKQDKHRYQSLYMKKLKTQTSLGSQSFSHLDQTSLILERQLKKISHQLHRKNSTFTKTIKKKTQLQNQLVLKRQSLKSRIQQKMRKSHNNMLQFRQKSNSSLSNRLKVENKKIQEIKRMQRTMYDQKYQKSKDYSTETQKFFDNLKDRRKKSGSGLSIDTQYLLKNRKRSPLFEPISNKKIYPIQSSKNSKSRSHSKQNPQHNQKPIFSMLRTPRQSILQKQKKKIQMQKSKQDSFLKEYIKKLQSIQQTRKKVRVQRKIPQTTIAKLISREYNDQQDRSRARRHHKSFVDQAVSNKVSFSQLYHKKLLQKKQKKTFFLSQSIANGDLLLKDETIQTNKFKLNKLIRESQNELARKQNFRYMQKYLNKRI